MALTISGIPSPMDLTMPVIALPKLVPRVGNSLISSLNTLIIAFVPATPTPARAAKPAPSAPIPAPARPAPAPINAIAAPKPNNPGRAPVNA